MVSRIVNIPSKPQCVNEVVESISAMSGRVDLYTWYEGPALITKLGAQFLKENLFEPLYARKKDVKIWAYSLEAWNFLMSADAMNETTLKGELINKINKLFVECIYSSAFFKFCTQFNADDPLYQLVNRELPKKQWLVNLSAKRKPREIIVRDLLGDRPSLVDCIKTWDVAQSYSLLQYLEGYYLIREAIVRGIDEGRKRIQVAFVLPNDEAKYYRDLPENLDRMLQAEFGDALKEVTLNVDFRFYKYGSQKSSRPYLGSVEWAVPDSEIESYFNYLER